MAIESYNFVRVCCKGFMFNQRYEKEMENFQISICKKKTLLMVLDPDNLTQ